MGFIKISHRGDFKHTENFLKKMRDATIFPNALRKYAQKGVDALASATPTRTGLTAASWTYEIHASKGEYTITFINTNENKGVNIAVILQYGHGTRNGGYVVGRDYINPAIQPVFDEIAEDAWREVVAS